MGDFWQLETTLREIELEDLHKFKAGTEPAPTLYKPSGYFKDFDKESREMTFVANEESPDRMGDIIEVDGWELKNFRAIPVEMFQHNYNVPPIGTVPRVWKSTKSDEKTHGGSTPQLLNTVKFDIDDPLASFLMGKYERRVMRAESVGFRPIEFEEIDSKGMFGSFRFTKQELLEISLVSIPAHPKALQKAMNDVGKFYIFMAELPEVKTVEPPPEPPVEPPVIPASLPEDFPPINVTVVLDASAIDAAIAKKATELKLVVPPVAAPELSDDDLSKLNDALKSFKNELED